jgi:hypothetical protein
MVAGTAIVAARPHAATTTAAGAATHTTVHAHTHATAVVTTTWDFAAHVPATTGSAAPTETSPEIGFNEDRASKKWSLGRHRRLFRGDA